MLIFKGGIFPVRVVSLTINGAFRDQTMAYIVSPEGSTAVSEHRTTQQSTMCDWKKMFLNVLSQDFNIKKVSVYGHRKKHVSWVFLEWE